MQDLPIKLRKDAITEALCELRFESDESNQMHEVVIGRLADRDQWRGYKNLRLPIADLPANKQPRTTELKYHPLFELREPTGSRIVRIGPHVLSLHVLPPYPGWVGKFSAEIDDLAGHLLQKLPSAKISRIGLRYINLLNSEEHGISSPRDLNYKLSIGDTDLLCPQMFSFKKTVGEQYRVNVRVASPEFIDGPKDVAFGALVDVDVFTSKSDASFTEAHKISEWLVEAHDIEKKEFFSLLKPEDVERLREQ